MVKIVLVCPFNIFSVFGFAIIIKLAMGIFRRVFKRYDKLNESIQENASELNKMRQEFLKLSKNLELTEDEEKRLMKELSKHLKPIVICAFTTKQKRQYLIENSIAVGVGFAILENAFVFASNVGNITFMTAILRAFGSGIMHVMTTLLIGFGLSFTIDRKKLYLSAPIGILATAIIYHSIYNLLVQLIHLV